MVTARVKNGAWEFVVWTNGRFGRNKSYILILIR